MNKEGHKYSPAPENLSSEDLSKTNISSIHAFVSTAKSLELQSSNPSHFAMSPQYKQKTEREFRKLRKELGVSARRGTQEFNEVMQGYIKQLDDVNYPYYWFGSESSLNKNSHETILFSQKDLVESENIGSQD